MLIWIGQVVCACAECKQGVHFAHLSEKKQTDTRLYWIKIWFTLDSKHITIKLTRTQAAIRDKQRLIEF